jgi:hypothetical protein
VRAGQKPHWACNCGMLDYTPIHLFEEERLGLEFHTASERFCLSIAVCTEWVEYLEHYELTREEFESLSINAEARLELAEKCRARQNDARLMEAPPPVRGTPCTGPRGAGLLSTRPNAEFRTFQIVRKERFSLAQEVQTGKYCLEIPIDITPHWESVAYYELKPEEYKIANQDKTVLLSLVEKCRNRENESHLIGPLPTPLR